ncbi:phytoene desaturase family protein [Leucobacter triazinivorans]|uniref:Pyridine nucleotide-disulfide oxidoreductase domain-containing protein 2 n=1 Tax=Leucobacter triazinivorans TaxID=1784719 RepID=A0A4P6KDU8_9MICO|nr:NAD(P)/FAD-dependent oxidoreductase [Leucobacter triazinivorans]QBE48412.1 NAD(P)/FAD-dependent oxidoreductase [Leucobacter triazinivorans]
MAKHVVVIGGGHNGLIAANYVAKAGHRVTLCEARASLGGPAGRFEFMPGYSSSITNSIGSFEGRIFDELQLETFGLRFHKPDVTLLHPMEDDLFIGWRDRRLVAEQMESYAAGESVRHRELIARLDALGAASGLSLWSRPEPGRGFLDRMDADDRSAFSDAMLEGSLMDLLDGALTTPQVKSMMMMLALNGQLLSPRARGSAFGLLLRPISRAAGGDGGLLGNQDAPLRGSVGLPIGSMGSIIDALTLSAHALGVSIRTNCRVEELLFDDSGRVDGVRLESGSRLSGIDAAIITVEPSLLPGMMPDYPGDAPRWPEQPKGSAFKVAVALDGVPSVRQADPRIPVETLLQAQFRIGPSPEYIEAAVDDGLAGRASDSPIIWGLIPTIASPGLAPPGKHLMSLNVWHAPHDLGREHWAEHGDRYVQSCLRQLRRLLPSIDEHIEDVRWYSPHDLEDEFALTSSNITHGDMTPDLMLDGRPGRGVNESLAQRGLYLGGAGTWPGGYVTGAPGRNSARTVVRELEEMER